MHGTQRGHWKVSMWCIKATKRHTIKKPLITVTEGINYMWCVNLLKHLLGVGSHPPLLLFIVSSPQGFLTNNCCRSSRLHPTLPLTSVRFVENICLRNLDRMVLFPFQDHDGLDLHIGISPLGLTVYHNRCKINFFPWYVHVKIWYISRTTMVSGSKIQTWTWIKLCEECSIASQK